MKRYIFVFVILFGVIVPNVLNQSEARNIFGMFASAQKLPEEQLEEDEYDMNNEAKKMNEYEREVFNNSEDDNLTMMSEEFE